MESKDKDKVKYSATNQKHSDNMKTIKSNIKKKANLPKKTAGSLTPLKLSFVKSEIPKTSTEASDSISSLRSKSQMQLGSDPEEPIEKSSINKSEEGSNAKQCAAGSKVSAKSANPIISPARYADLVKKADKALKEGKTFAFRHHYNVIRNTFLKRGWVELSLRHLKLHPSGKRTLTYEKALETLPKKKTGESQANYSKRCERFVLSALVEHKPVRLIWTFKRNNLDRTFHRSNSSILLNKLMNVPFVTKSGILRQLESVNWVWEDGIAEVYFPRSYIASSQVEMNAFDKNFKNTACISFLRYCVERTKESGWPVVFQQKATSQIPFQTFEFALRHCYHLLNDFHNNDIDFKSQILPTEQDWQNLLNCHILLTRNEAKIALGDRDIEPLLRNAMILLDSIKTHWPQYELDGYYNTWIVKPSFQNCGRGLVITNNLKDIQQLVSTPKTHYIIQKYIERPLLIHNTKFDIRQWFLVTGVKPLVIWMYKENYLRFSSQIFSLLNLHESVHLTNHCIQRKYPINEKRDDRLPKKNMWDSYTFQAYLRQLGKPEVYLDRIYPGIKRAIIATLLASQRNMSNSTNLFELFGADFVVTEDFYPWLLEINSCPDLARTTNVTSRMVPRVIEDIMKVVIDYPTNPNCSVGNFELIYQQSCLPARVNKKTELQVKGEEFPAGGGKSRLTSMKNNLLEKGKVFPTFEAIRREMYNHLSSISGACSIFPGAKSKQSKENFTGMTKEKLLI
ncbi:tubulin glycylase 3A-like isoform X2 [Hermetia illucens]|uniref:tubulin glycylase 3A-like isoform X2 n=1 Tax=Hermetia illucens TaxID=343691 RepID=UPI0018CC0FA4|nr:tubulin glycylase 3A-like isoform X2 [Hermetia illucens]